MLLVLWALGGPTRPYKAKRSLAKDAKDYEYYIRKGSSTVRARGADESELMSLAATVPFDDRFNQQARIEDLSRDLMQEYLQQVGSDLARQAPDLSLVELGRQMGVIGGPEESPFPLNVGLMMFTPEPWRFFPVMQIDVVWFPKEGPGGNKFSEKIFKGPIPRMTRDALDYIKRNFISETVIKHHGRAESTRVENFPYDAIEEAVVNAVYHRGYEVREPVEFEFDKDHSYFMVRLPAHPAAVEVTASTAGAGKAVSAPPVTQPVTPPVEKLLAAFSSGESLGGTEIRTLLGLKDRTHVRQYYIEPALSAGLIEYTIPDKPNSRLQQYRLTDKGHALLASQKDDRS